MAVKGKRTGSLQCLSGSLCSTPLAPPGQALQPPSEQGRAGALNLGWDRGRERRLVPSPLHTRVPALQTKNHSPTCNPYQHCLPLLVLVWLSGRGDQH